MLPEFREFPKIARLNREIICSEKLDGTNAQIFIDEDGSITAGSRNRWISSTDDNYGFAKWVERNKTDLLTLGPGQHFGEWWGQGILRGYGLKEKRFSLFNVSRWNETNLPSCCSVVPILYQGMFNQHEIDQCIRNLVQDGSKAVPGFMNPEGIVVFHTAAGLCFKITVKNDESPKSKVI